MGRCLFFWHRERCLIVQLLFFFFLKLLTRLKEKSKRRHKLPLTRKRTILSEALRASNGI